jgi:hypothetical protein
LVFGLVFGVVVVGCGRWKWKGRGRGLCRLIER